MMESANSQDGEIFLENVARFIRRHEKALANSLQVIAQRRQSMSRQNSSTSLTPSTSAQSSHTSTLAAALSLAGLTFRPHAIRNAHLTLTPHHLFYILSKIEELDINVGPMNIRTESIHNDVSSSNYISFLQPRKPARTYSDADSIHSVSSVRSVMSGMSMLWSGIGLGSASRTEKAKLALESDLKYLYAAFTKLPSLRLSPDHRTPLIKGYEQFPFDTAVPTFAFKNLQYLEIIDLDFRQFHGWDRLAEQLKWLIVRHGKVDDVTDLLTNIVLDDAEKRRKRSTRGYDAPSTPSWSVPSTPRAEYARSSSDPGSPPKLSPSGSPVARETRSSDKFKDAAYARPKGPPPVVPDGASPKRPNTGRPASSYRHVRAYSTTAKRTGSESSLPSEMLIHAQRADTAPTMLDPNVVGPSKWQRLAFLSLKENGLTALSARSVAPIAGTLRSFDLSGNHFTEIPESLSSFVRLASIDLSNCMIDSLHSLSTTPLPAITTLKIRSNRLQSLSGIERLPALEYVDIRDNKITDVAEVSRLSSIPSIRKVWVKQNPFTKGFPDYRVRIMNYFRKAAGFYEDVIIDDMSASYSERKQLIERTPESEVSGNVGERQSEQPVVIQQKSVPQSSPEAQVRRSSADVDQLERGLSNASRKARRGTRRRIVDLSQENGAPISQSKPKQETIVNIEHEGRTGHPSRELVVADVPAQPSPSTIGVVQDKDAFGFEHGLRSHVGKTWLNTLPEHVWNNEHRHSDHHLALQDSHTNHLLHQATTPPIVSGGRSLG